MPTPTKGARMGGSPAHQRHMLANLASALFEHQRITTTEARAKRLRPYAEKLITFAKRGDLHARRQVLTVITDKSVVHTLFAEIGPRFAGRPGGYTRITKLGPRKGDNAPMAVIELVESETVGQQAVGEAERARGSRFARRTAVSGSTAEAADDLAADSPTAAAVAERAEAEAVGEQVAVPTEGGDTEVVTETPAESSVPESSVPESSVPEEPAAEPAGAEVPDVADPTSEGAQGAADDTLAREAEVDGAAGAPGDDTPAG